MTATVKHGDTHDITLTVGVDLTGAQVRVLARRGSAAPIVLATDPIDLVAGVLSHTLTGTLEPGNYNVEVEITRDGKIQTAPTVGYTRLNVASDLG